MKMLYCCKNCRWPWKVACGHDNLKACPRCDSTAILDLGEAPVATKIEKLQAAVDERYEAALAKREQERRAAEDAAAFRQRYRWHVRQSEGGFGYTNMLFGTREDCRRLFNAMKNTVTAKLFVGVVDPDGGIDVEEQLNPAPPVGPLDDHYYFYYDPGDWL